MPLSSQPRPRRLAGSLALLLLLVPGCEEPPSIGNRCTLEQPSGEHGILALESPSFDCHSRICVGIAGERPGADEAGTGAGEPDSGSPPLPGLCTAECSSDDDCAATATTPCTSGFVCEVATVVGPYCCQRMCLCADQAELVPDDSAAACDPDLAENTCQNLPGRTATEAGHP
jgi:hypothetical protein